VHHSPHGAVAPGALPLIFLVTNELRASHDNISPNPRTSTTTTDAFPATHTPIPDASAAAPAPTSASSGSKLCRRCAIIVAGEQKGVVLLAPPHRMSYDTGATTATASDCEASTATTSDSEASPPAAAGDRTCDDLVPL